MISFMASCASHHASTRPLHYSTKGKASWYGPGFAGRLTANGERFNPNELTAAHRSLPFNTRVRVTHLENGKSVIVRINDRGPFVGRRIIDLSKAAAKKLDMLGSGTASVEVVAVSIDERNMGYQKQAKPEVEIEEGQGTKTKEEVVLEKPVKTEEKTEDLYF